MREEHPAISADGSLTHRCPQLSISGRSVPEDRAANLPEPSTATVYQPHPVLPDRLIFLRTVYGYFAAWQKEGIFDQLNGLLRRLVREAEGRDAEPSACALDAQSIKTSANVPAAGPRYRCGEENRIRLLSRVAATSPRVTKARTDTGYRTKAIDHGARLGIDVEVVQRDPGVKGFKVIPRRWVVERTFGWLMHHRRLARDYERHPHRSEAMIHVAMTDLISRRLTSESTPNWRDT
ncbi:transposase [Streptomyces sp. NPDC054783]